MQGGPEFPFALAYLLDWFQELQLSRTGNGFGPNPIAYQEIEAWQRLNGIELEPWEIQALKRIDLEWMTIMRPKK